MITPIIAAADIGSVKNKQFGWAIRESDGIVSKGTCITKFSSAVGEALNAGQPVALGFECPLFVPIREDPIKLTGARTGEGNRSWSAGAGACALATGLTETAWILREILRKIEIEPNLSFQWEDFKQHGGIFLWEAFVTGKNKSDTHSGDAELAVKAFVQSMPEPVTSNRIAETTVMSLVGAAALWAGWGVHPSILTKPCLVIAAQRPSE